MQGLQSSQNKEQDKNYPEPFHFSQEIAFLHLRSLSVSLLQKEEGHQAITNTLLRKQSSEESWFPSSEVSLPHTLFLSQETGRWWPLVGNLSQTPSAGPLVGSVKFWVLGQKGTHCMFIYFYFSEHVTCSSMCSGWLIKKTTTII